MICLIFCLFYDLQISSFITDNLIIFKYFQEECGIDWNYLSQQLLSVFRTLLIVFFLFNIEYKNKICVDKGVRKMLQ